MHGVDYPHPNPSFPPVPRKGALPWGIVALVLLGVALLGLLIAAVGNNDDAVLGSGIAIALGGMIAAGISFTRHARTGGWRSGRIIPALVAQGAPHTGTGAVAAGLLATVTGNGGLVAAAQNMVTLVSWWGGKQQMFQIAAGRFWDQFTEGSVIWVIQPQTVITAQFLEVAAPEEFKLMPVPDDAVAWLTEKLGGPTGAPSAARPARSAPKAASTAKPLPAPGTRKPLPPKRPQAE